MNTDVRKAVFCVIMGAEDFMDCFEKLLRLDLKGKQDREIVRVLLDCCGQENVYNPYYSLVGHKLCVFNHKFAYTFQLAYWDLFKQFATMPVRRASNLAHMFIHLVQQGSLSLAVLKILDFQKLESSAVLFLHVVFSALLLKNNDQDIHKIFGRISAKEELSALQDGIIFFFERHLKTALKRSQPNELANFKSKSKLAIKAMQQLVKI
eukprot:TRINITY_DN5328_c0_g1_i3.p1 TRINITY_DN5328_c0_g1~~TRINITY_DN5328_c0_g1_i3.p1  ORF type:complete len:208 (-),score=43.34 TRINITY_DN5328_c0_g1_i3:44-667(-)